MVYQEQNKARLDGFGEDVAECAKGEWILNSVDLEKMANTQALEMQRGFSSKLVTRYKHIYSHRLPNAILTTRTT